MSADQYIRQTLGELMVQIALLRAELDQVREALAQAERELAARAGDGVAER